MFVVLIFMAVRGILWDFQLKAGGDSIDESCKLLSEEESSRLFALRSKDFVREELAVSQD